MKRYGIVFAMALGLCFLLSGCAGSEAKRVFLMAENDLKEGTYEYALSGYEACVESGVEVALSYRGIGICKSRLGDHKAAVEAFTNALGCEKLSKGLEQDLYSYRITSYLALEDYERAMEDCRSLSMLDDLDADGLFLTGIASLGLDYYDEARQYFEKSYLKDSTYDRAIQVYEVYVGKGMEADGTYFLELSLNTSPKTAQEYCDCGRVYYYMGDYDNARNVLIEAQKRGSTEAILLLGMAYMGKGDYGNARAMYTQYIHLVSDEESGRGYNGLALCDMEQGNYESARAVIAEGIRHANTQEMQALLYNEIVSYELEYDFANARDRAKEYMALFPEDEVMRREYIFLKSRAGEGGN